MYRARRLRFSCITILLPRFVPIFFTGSPIPHVWQIKAKNDQTMLKYGVYHLFIFFVMYVHLIRHPRFVQSSQRVPWCVKIDLSFMGHIFSLT